MLYTWIFLTFFIANGVAVETRRLNGFPALAECMERLEEFKKHAYLAVERADDLYPEDEHYLVVTDCRRETLQFTKGGI